MSLSDLEKLEGLQAQNEKIMHEFAGLTAGLALALAQDHKCGGEECAICPLVRAIEAKAYELKAMATSALEALDADVEGMTDEERAQFAGYKEALEQSLEKM